MILVDSSAWIEFLRDTDTPVCRRVAGLRRSDLATCEPIKMEVLAGARDESHLEQLRRLLARASLLPTESVDYESAASLYRACRRQGRTVRRVIDCLIAAVAIRHNAQILHADADFETLARHTPLRLAATR